MELLGTKGICGISQVRIKDFYIFLAFIHVFLAARFCLFLISFPIFLKNIFIRWNFEHQQIQYLLKLNITLTQTNAILWSFRELRILNRRHTSNKTTWIKRRLFLTSRQHHYNICRRILRLPVLTTCKHILRWRKLTSRVSWIKWDELLFMTIQNFTFRWFIFSRWWIRTCCNNKTPWWAWRNSMELKINTWTNRLVLVEEQSPETF